MKNLYAVLSLATLFLLSGSLRSQTVIYTEEFNGSANGWVTSPVSPLDSSFWDWSDNKWAWSATGTVNNGAFFNTAIAPAIQSPTVANGSMVFNADFYTTQGNNTNVPPGPPYVPYICHLTSPNIDLSAVTAPVSLQFNQFLRFLNVSSGAPGNFRASVTWSTDNGLTWAAPVNAGDGQNVNQYGANNAEKTIPIPGVQGSANFLLRFTWSSDFYFWVLDDIKLLERPPHDMQVNENFFAVAPNLIWPLPMVEEFGFLADITNLGSEPQTNVTLNITIEDEGSNVVYTEDLNYGTVAIDTTIENEPFPGAGFLPTEMGVYSGTYTISADSADLEPDNNSLTFEFSVSDTLFAKEIAPTSAVLPASGNWDVDEPWSWAYGNYFYVPTAGNYLFNNVWFSVEGNAAFAGENLTIRIYEWTDDNEDAAADPGEREPVATMIYTITGDEMFENLISLPVKTLLGDDVPLQDDTEYLVMVEFSTDETGSTLSFGHSIAVDYDAMTFRSDLDGKPRYSRMLGINGNLDEEPYSSAGFTGGGVPSVRISLKIVDETKELLNPAEVLNISPNPANDYVAFDVTLKETSSLVRVELLDMTGKSFGVREFQNLKEVSTSFNTANLANGSYLVRIDTDYGYTTEMFVVQK